MDLVRKRKHEVNVKIDLKSHFVLRDNYWCCKHCDKKIKYDPTGSTTRRRDHVLNFHMDLLQHGKDSEVKAKEPKLSFFPQLNGNEHINRCIVRFFAQFNIPYVAVDSDTFKDLMKCTAKNVKLPCRKQLSNILVPQYATEIRASNAAATEKQDISLSFDEYSKGTRRFLGIVCNYIDNFWTLKFRRLCVEAFPKTTTGEEIALAVKKNTEKLRIKSVVSSTRDGGSNVVKACRLLGYGDIHCYDHCLNLGIVYAYKNSIAFVLIEKERALSGSFAKSPTATVHLKECGAEYSMKTACFTRWNWMGRVNKCILQNHPALEKYALHHTDGKKSTQRKLILAIDDDDLATIKEFEKVFQFFEEQFKMAESRSALASSILYMAFQVVNMARKGSKNEVVDDFLKKFLQNFEPRVKLYRDNELIKIATFFDPRFCMKTKLFSSDEWDEIKNMIINKFDDDDVQPPKIVEIGVEDDAKEHQSDDAYGWADLDDEPATPLTTSKLKDEMTKYLEKEKSIPPPLPNKNTTDLALDFWKENAKNFPILSSLAKKYLSILASSAEPERCFSTVTDLFMNTHRNGLSDDSIEDIMTIKNELILEKVENSRKKEETIVEEIFVLDEEQEKELQRIIEEEDEATLLDD